MQCLLLTFVRGPIVETKMLVAVQATPSYDLYMQLNAWLAYSCSRELYMSKSSRRDPSSEYKAQADAVLLNRGRLNGVHLDTKGKSESQIFDILVALRAGQQQVAHA